MSERDQLGVASTCVQNISVLFMATFLLYSVAFGTQVSGPLPEPKRGQFQLFNLHVPRVGLPVIAFFFAVAPNVTVM